MSDVPLHRVLRSRIWEPGVELKAPARMVAQVLGNHLNAEGKCWPSINRIAACAGLSRPCVIRALRQLTEEDPPIFRRVSRGRRKSHVYELVSSTDEIAKTRDARRSKRTRPGSPAVHESDHSVVRESDHSAATTPSGQPENSEWSTSDAPVVHGSNPKFFGKVSKEGGTPLPPSADETDDRETRRATTREGIAMLRELHPADETLAPVPALACAVARGDDSTGEAGGTDVGEAFDAPRGEAHGFTRAGDATLDAILRAEGRRGVRGRGANAPKSPDVGEKVRGVTEIPARGARVARPVAGELEEAWSR